MMQISTVLLDAGGIILDESEHERVRVEIAVETLKTVLPDYTATALYADLEEAIKLFCPKVLAYAFWKHLSPDRERFNRLYDRFLAEWSRCKPELKLMTGFGAELKVMARYLSVGIAGQYGSDLLALLEDHGLLEYFRFRFTQDDFEITKPDPRYLEQIAARCGVEPRQCIMVGDRIDNDVIPARQLGMKVVLVRVGLHRNQRPRIPWEEPDAELDGITGLGQAVVKLAP
jgi:HAD superfamily hydrolase (TIGR01549 family)